MSWPLRVTTTLETSVPAGRFTATSAAPPEIRSARLERTLIETPASACAGAAAALTAAAMTVAVPRARRRPASLPAPRTAGRLQQRTAFVIQFVRRNASPVKLAGSRTMSRRAATSALLVLALALASCGGGSGAKTSTARPDVDEGTLNAITSADVDIFASVNATRNI